MSAPCRGFDHLERNHPVILWNSYDENYCVPVYWIQLGSRKYVKRWWMPFGYFSTKRSYFGEIDATNKAELLSQLNNSRGKSVIKMRGETDHFRIYVGYNYWGGHSKLDITDTCILTKKARDKGNLSVITLFEGPLPHEHQHLADLYVLSDEKVQRIMSKML